MTLEEVVEQLDSIMEHCKEWTDKEEPDSIWHKDIAALAIAKRIIEKEMVRNTIKKGPGAGTP